MECPAGKSISVSENSASPSASIAIDARLGEADFIVVGLLPVTAAHLAAAPRLRGVLKHGVGVDNIDLQAATPGADLNWLEDVTLLEEDGVPAVFDRYSNSFLKIYFAIPEGQADDIARKVLIAHLQSGNSYGIRLKAQHAKFPQPTLGPWVEGSATAGQDWQPSVLEGWEPPDGH